MKITYLGHIVSCLFLHSMLICGCHDSTDDAGEKSDLPNLRLVMPYRIDNGYFIGARIQVNDTGGLEEQVPLIIAISNERDEVSKIITSADMRKSVDESGKGNTFTLNYYGSTSKLLDNINSSDLVVIFSNDEVVAACLYKGEYPELIGEHSQEIITQKITEIYSSVNIKNFSRRIVITKFNN